MALLIVSTEDYSELYQLPGDERQEKRIIKSALEEVLRMHGVRCSASNRSKVQMIEALNAITMLSLFRSTLGYSDTAPGTVDVQADLRAINWNDGDIREVVTLEPAES